MEEEITSTTFLIFFSIVVLMIFSPRIITVIEKQVYYRFGKIYFTHFIFKRRVLSLPEKKFLYRKVSFYRNLDSKKKSVFEHRIAIFIENYKFYSRGKVPITRDIKLLVAASATKLTFGFRDFIFSVLSTILIYPRAYTSKTTGKGHKGEFNPRLKTLVFSWEDFLKGYKIPNDNVNLAVHEFTHVIHINSYKEKDLNAQIFKKEYKSLKKMIREDKDIKESLLTSDYFRKYAYENQYEFIAVLIECFIETPEEFKSRFPKIYEKIKIMLNFNFLHY